MAVTRQVRRCRIGLALAFGWSLYANALHAQQFDPAFTSVTFELRTRWGQRLEGYFPHFKGQVDHLPDGGHQVRMTLETTSVEILGYPRYTEFSRSRLFFDVERYPLASFQSDPYRPELLRTGGTLTGVLRMHGISRRESFVVEPSQCQQPGYGCDVVARGSVRRENYGMNDWQIAVQRRVQFQLRLRLQQEHAH